MIAIAGRMIGAAFAEACARYGPDPFLVAPPRTGGASFTYDAAAAMAARWADTLAGAGYGTGQRIAVLIGNRPEHLVLKLALNAIGVSIVPVNPDYRPGEVAYLLEDSAACLAITDPAHAEILRAGIVETELAVPLVMLDELDRAPPAPDRSPTDPRPRLVPQSEASLLYTSGTTGRPKGCILSHEYELMIGARYLSCGGAMRFGPQPRILNPLPLYHLNAACVSFMGAMLSGGCQIQPPRFSRRFWWQDVRDTRAEVLHCLGIVAPAVLSLPPAPDDTANPAKLAVSAGIDPSLHRVFETRFGLELVEVWGMTEMCRLLAASDPDCPPDSRAIGRAFPGLETRVVDAADRDLPPGHAGELLLRHSAQTPSHGFFSGYLNRPEATEEVWRGGWFHTGDTVTMDASGLIFFVDRRKNIIRRSGENIAAAEVEAVLQERAEVAQVAVLAIPDPLREEEVMACVVPADGALANGAEAALARTLFDHVHARLAYFKAPGWILFRDTLPVTGTQKILKHKIFTAETDPSAGAHDFRALKTRDRPL